MQDANNSVAWVAALLLAQQDHPTPTEHSSAFCKVPLCRGSCCSSWLLHLQSACTLGAKDQPALGKEALNIVKKTDFDTGTFIRSSVRMRVLWPDPDHITCGQLYKNQGYCLARVALGCPGAECPHGPLSGMQGTPQLLWQASPGGSAVQGGTAVKCFSNPCVLENMVQPYQQAYSARKLRCPEAALTTEHLSYTTTPSSLSSYIEACFFLFPVKNIISF